MQRYSKLDTALLIKLLPYYGSFTPKLNLQPTGFRLASNRLQTGKMQLGYIGIAWFHSHQFYNQKPVGSRSVAILIWCDQVFNKNNSRSTFTFFHKFPTQDLSSAVSISVLVSLRLLYRGCCHPYFKTKKGLFTPN